MRFVVVAAVAAVVCGTPTPYPQPPVPKRIQWNEMSEILLVDMSQRLMMNYATSADTLSKQEFQSFCKSDAVWSSLTKRKHLSLGELLSGIAAASDADRSVYEQKQKGKKLLPPEDSTVLLRDYKLNCTLRKLYSPLQALKGAFDKEGDRKVISLADLSGKVRRIMTWEGDSSWEAVTRSKDIDRSGTASMMIRGAGACMFLAKQICVRDLDFRTLGDTYGLPGLTGGHLLDIIRGEPVTMAGSGRHLAGVESPPVPIAAVVRFIADGIKILPEPRARDVVSLLDCDGSGLLDGHALTLALLTAYSEVVQSMPKRLIPKLEEDGTWEYHEDVEEAKLEL